MLKTRSGLPKYCGWNLDRASGKRRVRFRKGAFSTYISGTPWSEDFMRAYAAALDGVQALAQNIGADRTIPGSVNALIASYYTSPEFRGLKTTTQRVRRNIIERFREEHGDKPIAKLGTRHISDIIGSKADTPEAGNNLLKVLRVLLGYAVRIEMVESNPALGVKRYKRRGEGFHAWTESEVEQFRAVHALGTKPRLALELLLNTGQRREDMVRMGRQHMQGDEIALRQEKTDTPLMIPIHADLATALESVPKTNLTFLLTEFGKPFTPAGFGNWFRDQCDAAGLPQCSAHGLRKLAATRLANAQCSAHMIMAITGHKSLSQVDPYTKQADQKRLAREAMAMLRAKQQQTLSSNEPMLDKKRKKS